MNKNTIRIKVNKLFNYKDIDIILDNNLSILVGENGCGKSTVLKQLNNIINNDFISLSRVPFEKIELYMDKNEKIEINYKDIIQLEESKCEEFRFIVLDSLKRNNDFNEFYKYIIDKLSNKKASYIKYNEENNDNPIEYFKDDLQLFGLDNYNIELIDNLISDKKMSKCIFGSKMYLKLIFNMYNKLDIKLVKSKKIKKSYYYSFIDLDDEYYKFNNLNFLNKYILKKYLSKMFIKDNKKEIKFNNKEVEIYNKKTKEKIIYLSSGEKKIMQLFKALFSVNKKTIILLDEPELSMSIIWKEELIKLLKKYSKHSLVIIASQQISITNEEDLNYFVPILSR